MRIKKVEPGNEDVRDLVLRLDAECFPADVRPGLHGDWWVVYDGTEPMGYAGMWASVRTEACGYLCRAGVLPRARGKGLQRKLLKVRERAAKRKGWVQLITDTSPDNDRSMNNLIACGFRAYRPSEQWSYDHFVYWRKIIDEGVA